MTTDVVAKVREIFRGYSLLRMVEVTLTPRDVFFLRRNKLNTAISYKLMRDFTEKTFLFHLS